MPELPEVQVVINYLRKNILNKKIINVEIFLLKLIKNCNEVVFKKALLNKQIIDIKRRGKYLIFLLSDGLCFLSHLRMEGKYFYEDKSYKRTKHDYIIFTLEDKTKLIYNDTRQFGTFEIFNTIDDLNKSKSIAKLGIEPFNDNFNFEYFFPLVRKSSKSIKTFLLDQSNVVGIGNIYANEILFASKINPFMKANNLTDSNILDIINNTKRILSESIKNNGTTIHTFRFSKWSIGDYQKFLMVHMRKNHPCSICGTLIEKVEINGRGTYYCPKCQNVNIKGDKC